MKKRFLIVSSRRRHCGIAQDTRYLEGPLRRALSDWEVEIAPLPTDEIHSASGRSRKLVRLAMRDILRKARSADVVNLQFEPGLFGRFFFTILPRVKSVLDASSRVIVTHHTTLRSLRTAAKAGLNFSRVKGYLLALNQRYLFGGLFNQFRRTPLKFVHMVHAQEDLNGFNLPEIPPASVRSLPLSCLTRDMKKHYAKISGDVRESIDERYDTAGKKILGCFGFIQPYKGIDIAIRALGLIPDDYVLFVVGGNNPVGSVSSKRRSYLYLQRLRKMAASHREGRIHFCGAPDNDGFIKFMSICDGVLFPYREAGLSASGPAAIALDLRKPLYCSRSHVSLALGRYAEGAISFFDVDDHIGLARRIMDGDALGGKRVEARRRYAEKYNVENRAEAYAGACEELLQA